MIIIFLTDLQKTLDWIVAYYLEKTAARVSALKNQGKTQFDIRNDSQVFNARNLSISYGYRTIFYAVFDRFSKLPDGPEKNALMKLVSLYGANLIVEKYMGVLCEGGFVQNVNAAGLYETGILNILPLIKEDAVGLVDAIAFPDFINNSCLGMADGEIYKHLKSTLYQSPGVFERPSWYQDITNKESYLPPKYKL